MFQSAGNNSENTLLLSIFPLSTEKVMSANPHCWDDKKPVATALSWGQRAIKMVPIDFSLFVLMPSSV